MLAFSLACQEARRTHLLLKTKKHPTRVLFVLQIRKSGTYEASAFWQSLTYFLLISLTVTNAMKRAIRMIAIIIPWSSLPVKGEARLSAVSAA